MVRIGRPAVQASLCTVARAFCLLCACVVAWRAECFPVAGVAEDGPVALMGLDVINDRCGDDLAPGLASLAYRVGLQESLAAFFP
jgi:hypothetical protein